MFGPNTIRDIDKNCNTPNPVHLRTILELVQSTRVTSKSTNLKDSNQKRTEATVLASRERETRLNGQPTLNRKR